MLLSRRALDRVRAVRRALADRGAPAPPPARARLRRDDPRRARRARLALPAPAARRRPRSTTRPRRTSRRGTRRPCTSAATRCGSCCSSTSPRRAADKLKYLAGSEAAMGAWIGDVAPEAQAEALRRAIGGGRGMNEVADAMHGFAEWYGRTPIGAWSAPGRVNLIGEHTDYNDGFVFPFAIDHRTAVALGDRDDRVVRVASSFAPEAVEIHLDELDARRDRRLGRLPARRRLGARRARRRPRARARRRPLHRELRAGRRRPLVVGGDRERGRPRARRALGPRLRPADPREGRPARREPRRRRADRHHGPVGVAARRGRRRRSSSTAAASTPT